MASFRVANIFQHPFLRSNRALHCLEAAPPVGTEKNK